MAIAHRSTSRWPRTPACQHVLASQAQPLARAHCSTARWPQAAAAEHVEASQAQPLQHRQVAAVRR